MTLAQIISGVIILLGISFAIRYLRGLFRWGMMVATVLVVFGGYSWHEAIQAPIRVVQNVAGQLNLGELQNKVRYENGVLAVQVTEGNWISADQIKLVNNQAGQDIVIEANGTQYNLPASDGLSKAFDAMQANGILKGE